MPSYEEAVEAARAREAERRPRPPADDPARRMLADRLKSLPSHPGWAAFVETVQKWIVQNAQAYTTLRDAVAEGKLNGRSLDEATQLARIALAEMRGIDTALERVVALVPKEEGA